MGRSGLGLVGAFLLLSGAAGALLILPGVLGAEVALGSGDGCDAAFYAPAPGALRLRVFLEDEAQREALDSAALAAYLADRTGREVRVALGGAASEETFRSLAGERAVWPEALVFLADRDRFTGVATASGPRDALGYAADRGACLFVAFQPAEPVACDVGASEAPVQPAYAYLAHELGHALGLGHTPAGLMGHAAWAPCSGADVFDAAQRAVIAAA